MKKNKTLEIPFKELYCVLPNVKRLQKIDESVKKILKFNMRGDILLVDVQVEVEDVIDDVKVEAIKATSTTTKKTTTQRKTRTRRTKKTEQ